MAADDSERTSTMASLQSYFWASWILGSLASAFVWLFGHVPAASAIILATANSIALALLVTSIAIGKRSWQTGRSSEEFGPLVWTIATKVITLIACLQASMSLWRLADLAYYELWR